MTNVKMNAKENTVTRSSAETSCPNCWGVTQYDGKSCDGNTIGKSPENMNLGWIQDYVKSNL